MIEEYKLLLARKRDPEEFTQVLPRLVLFAPHPALLFLLPDRSLVPTSRRRSLINNC